MSDENEIPVVAEPEEDIKLYEEASKLYTKSVKEFHDDIYRDADQEFREEASPETYLEIRTRELKEQGKTKKEIAEELKKDAESADILVSKSKKAEMIRKEALDKQFKKYAQARFGTEADIITKKTDDYLEKKIGKNLDGLTFKTAAEKFGLVANLHNTGKIFVERPLKTGVPEHKAFSVSSSETKEIMSAFRKLK